MEPLRQMATLAAQERLKGRSFKRNSILKPLDIILENLEREPKQDFRDMVRRASQREIFDHIDSITEHQYKLGLVKRERKIDQISAYVNIFFDEILEKIHGDDVNRLLQRSKLMRSAYLMYYRDATTPEEKSQADKEQAEEAREQLQNKSE